MRSIKQVRSTLLEVCCEGILGVNKWLKKMNRPEENKNTPLPPSPIKRCTFCPAIPAANCSRTFLALKVVPGAAVADHGYGSLAAVTLLQQLEPGDMGGGQACQGAGEEGGGEVGI